MNNYLGHVIAFCISILISGVLVYTQFESDKRTLYDTLRVIIPAVILIGTLIWSIKAKFLSEMSAGLLALSLPFYILVVNWIPIFSITDYRVSHRPVIFSMSGIYIIYYFSALYLGRGEK
ncbi:hypothetical protein [Vreelandella sp. GE22]